MVELDKEAMEKAHLELYKYGLTPITARCAETFLSAYLEAAGMTWRPISEAPKDGTDFLVHCVYMPNGGPAHIHFMVGCFAPDGKFRSWPGRHPYSPTHFMPLPASPKDGK